MPLGVIPPVSALPDYSVSHKPTQQAPSPLDAAALGLLKMNINNVPLALSGPDAGVAGWTLDVHVDGVSTAVVKRASEEMCRISVTGDHDEDDARARLEVKARRWIAAFLARHRSMRS